MAFRLWNYLCKIWDRHLVELDNDSKTEKKKKTKKIKLPLIYPLTVYHGKTSPYPFSMDLFDLFQEKEFARHILLKPFPLIDLTVIPDDEILRHQHAAVMELIQKHIFKRNIQEVIEQLKQHGHLALIHDLNHGQYLIKVVEYIIKKGEAASPEILIEALKSALPDDEDTVMTVAQQLQQRAREQAMHEVAKTMFAEGLDEKLVAKTTGLSKAELAKLKKEI